MCLLDACICVQNTDIYAYKTRIGYICVQNTHRYAYKTRIYMGVLDAYTRI